MNKSFYTPLIILLWLTAVSGLWQSILRLVVGTSFPFLDSFIPWFLVTNLAALAGAILLLTYYHYRKYQFTFYTSLVALVASLCYAFVIYKSLTSREMTGYYTPALMLHLTLTALYAGSLIVPPTGENRWLKYAGVALLAATLVALGTTAGLIFFPSGPVNAVLSKTAMVVSTIWYATPILFCIHFQKERREVASEKEGAAPPKPIGSVLAVLVIFALMFTAVFGFMITSESYHVVYWRKRIFEDTKQLAQLFKAHTYANSKGDTLFYRLLKPLNYEPTKKYPLVVSLPYGGQPATDTIRQLEGAAGAGLLSSDTSRRKYPAFLFIPNLPPGASWGGLPDHQAADSIVYEAILSLDHRYSIDPKRRYVIGLSKGGYGAWHFICTRPDMFAAAIPVCGAGDPALAHRIVNTQVWAFHGRHDRNVPVSGSRDMIKAMREAGGDPKYTEFPDLAHNIWHEVTLTPGIWDWLFDQKQR